jgi:hypothetical protein
MTATATLHSSQTAKAVPTGGRATAAGFPRIRRLLTALAPVAVAVAVFAPGSALAVDVDQDGDHDMLVREGQFYPRTAGGDCVSSFRTDGGVSRQIVTFSVRPPPAWPLWGLTQQRIAWRSNFFDVASGQRLATSPWEYAWTDAGGTVFGGAGSQNAMLGTRLYLAGNHHYEHDASLSVRASVDVVWQNPNNGQWVSGSAWVNDMTIRTFGGGKNGARLPILGGIGGNIVGIPLLQRNTPRC